MTDRELLELAGSALAREVAFDRSTDRFLVEDEFGVVLVPWNPLTDDGDALRLAVKLSMMVRIYPKQVDVIGFGVSVEERTNDDPYAATRRAIVRAAAEIGKGVA